MSVLSKSRAIPAFLASMLLCTATSVFGQDRFVVAVVGDGPDDPFQTRQQFYVDELLALTSSEFDIELDRRVADWDPASIRQELDSVYSDPAVDLVLVVGFVANQLAATRDEFPKPTFLPLIIDTGLLVSEPVDGKSGIPNLNYLSIYANFGEDLDTLARIVSFRTLVLLIDEIMSDAIPELREIAFRTAASKGVELIEVRYDGVDNRLLNKIPAGTDAIVSAGLPRMPRDAYQQLIEDINAAGLPSYSFVGVEDVERGMLVTNAEPKDVERQARYNALNMQAVMLGGRAEDQPTEAQIQQRLTINMATARKLGISPSFDVLNDSVLLNQEIEATGQELGLVDIAMLALEQNQDLVAESYGVLAGVEDIAGARSSLLPQIDATASYTTRNVSPSVESGLFSERSTDASFGLSQLVYSDAATANLTIQKELQRSRESAFQQFRLDVVLAATTSYYTVLNARSQLSVQENNLRITQANFELAEDRVRLGTSTAADVYRWEAEVARAQILVLNARAALNQAWDSLARILHLPQGERIALREATFDEPFVMTREEFDQLVASPADYATFSRFYIARAIRQAPEIEQLNAQIDAKRREVTSRQRAYWLPDFSLGAQYTSNLGQSGVGAGQFAGEDLNDWSFGLQATLPLFAGGLRKANLSRSNLELRQLESLRISTEERVEESVRAQLHAAQAAYAQIDLSSAAAEASRRNFELVSDAYARGTVTIIDLLDAQDTSIAASASAAESLYNFLITIMSLQRSVGGYDYLLPRDERTALADEFRRALRGTE